jgi:hypothetical protein
LWRHLLRIVLRRGEKIIQVDTNFIKGEEYRKTGA